MSRKTIGVYALTFMNIIAIDNLRSLPFAAEFGLSLITYYALCALCFLMPIGFITAELASAWPKRGGIYVWIREAFGHRIAFTMVWIQWIYNIFWYPIALTFIVSTGLHTFTPTWHPDTSVQAWIMTGLFWLATWVNYGGLKGSSFISTAGALVGTLLPMLIIVGLASVWLGTGHQAALPLDWHQLLPHYPMHTQLPFFTALLFGLVGLEMTAVHADEIEPCRTFLAHYAFLPPSSSFH